MDANEFASALMRDPPFAYPEPDDKTRSILVETSSVKLYRQELRIRLKSYVHNSGITAVVGRARSGKTQFLQNLGYVTNVERKNPGVLVYLYLQGEDLTFDDLLRRISDDENLAKRASELGVERGGTPTQVINQVVDRLRAKEGGDALLYLAVDNLDEHFRQREARARSQNISPKEDIESFLGLFRLLTGKGGVERGLCVLFGLTKNAREKFRKEFLGDPTLAERIDFILDPTRMNEDLELAGVSGYEATTLVAEYMAHWARRNHTSLPDVKGTVVDGRNIYPFTPEAVQLVWASGLFAGHVTLGCRNAINRKCTSLHPTSFDELVISEVDAAYAISMSAGMFPELPSTKPRIDQLIGAPEIEREIEAWIGSVAATKYGGDVRKGDIKTAFEGFLQAVGKEGNLNLRVQRDAKVIDPYTQKAYTIDLRVQLESAQIGISVTEEPLVDLGGGKPLSVALKNGNVRSGIFVYAGKPPELGYHSGALEGIGHELFEDLQDFVHLRKFNNVVKVVPLGELISWGMIWSRELPDPGKKLKAYAVIEGKLKFLSELVDMSAVEPGEIRLDRPRPGDTYSGGA